MENLKKLYITEDGTPFYTHYNGSWNVMKMETTDGLDYSLTISEMLDDSVYNYEEEEGVELEGQEYTDFIKSELEYLSEVCGFDLVQPSWFDTKESEFNYLQKRMLEAPSVLDYVFRQGEKPHYTKVWTEVSEFKRGSYTMEEIRQIIMGYNTTEQFAFCMKKDQEFWDKIEKMKTICESPDANKEELLYIM